MANGAEKYLLLARTKAKTICLIALLVLWCAIAFSIALTEIAFVLALLFWILWHFTEHAERPKADPVMFAPLAAYVLLCVLSIFWSEAPKESFRGIFKVLKYAVLFWMTAEIFASGTSRKKFENTFCVFFAILVLDGVFQYFFGRDLLRGALLQDASSGPRVSASFKSFGLFASYLISSLPYLIALGLNRWGKKNPRNVWIAAGIAVTSFGGTILLILTRSRGALLSCLASGLLFLALQKKIRWIFIAALLFAGMFFVLPKSMIIHQNAEGHEQSIVERYYLWDRALNVIKAKPLTGTGINTYAARHGKYDKTKNWRVRDYYAHNGYLQAAAETGIPSLIFLWLFLGIYFHRSLSAPRTGAKNSDRFLQGGLLLGILNFLMMTCVDTVFHNPQAVMVFWYLLGLQYAYGRNSETVQRGQAIAS